MHCGCESADHHGAPGMSYYVSVQSGARTVLAAGPYATHREAQAKVPAVIEMVSARDPRAPWYAYGTSGAEGDDLHTKFGVL